MNEIFDNLSKYHFLETLIPGYIFLALFDNLIIPINVNDFFIFSILSYFTGLIISRLSSLITKKILFKLTKTIGVNYEDYIKACNNDSKIEVLSTDKNLYRNMITLCILLLIFKIGNMTSFLKKLNSDIIILFGLMIIAIIFSISFLKLNNMIVERTKISIKYKKDKRA